jgi:hypothetical protein
MSVLELKNDLHRLVVTTEDEVILENVRDYFLNLTSHEDWCDSYLIPGNNLSMKVSSS